MNKITISKQVYKKNHSIIIFMMLLLSTNNMNVQIYKNFGYKKYYLKLWGRKYLDLYF